MNQPKNPAVAVDVKLEATISSEHMVRLHKAADENGISINEMIEDMIDAYFGE